MRRYASRADYEMDWHLTCDYCLEKILEDDVYLTGQDESGEWHTCCQHCGTGSWLYLEDSDGNVLIEDDGNAHYWENEDAD